MKKGKNNQPSNTTDIRSMFTRSNESSKTKENVSQPNLGKRKSKDE
jgi:hypothetical protein